MNDLIIRRYERQYGLDASPGTQSKVCKQSVTTPAPVFYYPFPPLDPMPPQNHPGYTAVQHDAASFHTKNSIVALVPALVTFLFLGSNCDSIGRRPLLVLPFAGKVVWYSLMLIIVSRNLSDAWLLAGHAIEAVFGSSGLVMLSAFAFITDCTNGPLRNRAFLVTEGVTFLTRIVPVLAVGIWLRFYLYTVPLSICLVLSVIALLYALFIQPESMESV
jgi:MFS family permease